MIGLDTTLMQMQRPKTLVRAAKAALADHRREPALRRLLKTQHLPGAARLACDLLALEAMLDEQRRAGDAAYAVTRHIRVLTALIAEAHRHRYQPQQPDMAKVG